MHLTNDSPSFTPVHSQIRAIGPRDLHLPTGRGRCLRKMIDNSRNYALKIGHRTADDISRELA